MMTDAELLALGGAAHDDYLRTGTNLGHLERQARVAAYRAVAAAAWDEAREAQDVCVPDASATTPSWPFKYVSPPNPYALL